MKISAQKDRKQNTEGEQKKSCRAGGRILNVHLERKTGFEPATPTLARLCSTPELLPQFVHGGAEEIRTLDLRRDRPTL
jgi:hypothetical protein